MPRANGIFVVKGAYGEPDIISAVFTVKWECAKWIKAQDEPTSYLVYRYTDGAGSSYVHSSNRHLFVADMPTRVPIEEFLRMETP